jgi:hypothetical protein
MNKNVVQQKSFNFSLRIIEIYKHLYIEKKEFVLSRQVLEAVPRLARTSSKLIHPYPRLNSPKISIAHKEARETCYWLRLLFHSNYLDGKRLIRWSQTAMNFAHSSIPS